MSMDLERIKEANRVEDVINETEPLEERLTRYLKGKTHDSLVVDTHKQYFVWHKQNTAGDVINWLEEHRGMAFREAVEWLCQRAGLPVNWGGEDAEVWKAVRVKQDSLTAVAKFLRGKVATSSAAAAYIAGRGWSAELAAEAGLGFWDGDRKGLLDHLKMAQVDVASDVVQACLKIPTNMLIYTHQVGSRVVYMTGRAIEGRGFYNLERGLVGDKQPYWNHAYHHKAEHVVVVEGQADAVTLGMWGIAAVALAGLNDTPALVKQLEGHDQVYVALDADAAGNKAIVRLAEGLGATVRIVSWPDVKDANDWLKAGGSGKACRELLGRSPIYAKWLCQRAAAAGPMEYAKAKREAVEAAAALPDYIFEEEKRDMARELGVSLGDLNGMVKALKKDKDSTASSHKIEVVKANGRLDDHLFEMIYFDDPDKGPRTMFGVRYPDGHIGTVGRLETDTYRIDPLSPFDSLLEKGVVRIASGLGKYTDEVELQKEIQAFIHKYVDLPEHIERLSSYYVMLTWVYDAFYVLPYLRARGSSDSGKSRFTEVVGALCMRNIWITGSTTPSPVFRTMERWGGLTVVMDEADLPHSETSADWVQMLNTGYKRGFAILRTNMKNGEAVPEAFDGFGPKILNMRGRFADDATESRCLTWETNSGRGVRADILRYMDRDVFIKEGQDLRNKLLTFRLRNFTSIEVDYNHEATRDLPGRLVEITVPLMSISKDEGFKANVMEFIQQMNQKAIITRQATLAGKVLEAVLRAYWLPDDRVMELPDSHIQVLKLQVAHITRQANKILNDENAEASLGDDEDFKPQKQLSASYVGKIIGNELNLETEKASVGTRPMVIKWDESRIQALVARYGLEDYEVELITKCGERLKKLEAAQAAQQEGLKL